MLLKNAFIAFLSLSTLYADTLKECKTEADKISGCVKRDYHSNGKLWEEIPYKNGKREGIGKWYYENGDLVNEIPYKNDKREGMTKWYYRNGNLESETPYKNGKREGMSKWYYENGSLKAETPFNNDGVNGDMKLYTEDKKLLALIKAENHKFISGKCFNNKVLTDKELKEIRRDVFIERAIIYLKEICLKGDSK
ncbi:hypothetical protein XJ32_07430 [Helicobacter bilis]|uniref:Toxin-antitoxin system YwqK family antitoxin n=1 Tax=Helicobacter bilis TaxID=37372 RepID=A0A1Q2LHT2_9HELI|nr:toxin-antitoxin system YwqK family antitoxin [Helicobacter bilis]AQQ59943.1 hypothetical protein XJ32_07430 [Helicobacter bilis]